MRFLFLAPLLSAFGEALCGARLAAAAVARGHDAFIAAPSDNRAIVPAGVPFIPIDGAMTQLDTSAEVLARRVGCDVLVLVDASAVAKAGRALGWSVERVARAAPRTVSIDCWNLTAPPATWDYGPVVEPLDRWLLEHTPVIRPAPIARADAPGAYAALPAMVAPTADERAATRRRLGLPEDGPLLVWPTARWQVPHSHTVPALAAIAARLPDLVTPSLRALGDGVAIAHVSPAPLAESHQPPGYRRLAPLPSADFEALLGAADALLCFNAAATSLATALALGVPTVVCAPREPDGARRVWAWPLGLDDVLAPTVHGHPFYDTMTLVDAAGEALGAALHAALFDAQVREARRAAQAAYRDQLAALPSGVDRLLEVSAPAARG